MKIALPIILLLASTLSSPANILIGNMTNSTAGAASPQNTFWLAQSFLSGTGGTVGSISVYAAKHATQTNNMLYLYSDAGSQVGSLLYTFDASSMTTTSGPQTFSISSGSGVINSTTRYWVVFAPDNINTSLWFQTTGSISDGTGVIPFARAFSGNSGTSWTDSSASSALMFELNTVPEPASYAVFTGLFFFAFCLYYRRR